MKRSACLTYFFLFSIFSFGQSLPVLKATINNSSLNGYYFLSSYYSGATLFMILDHSGYVVYCKRMSEAPSSYNFSLQPNGLISYSNQAKYFFMDSTFRIVDSVECKGIYKTDP